MGTSICTGGATNNDDDEDDDNVDENEDADGNTSRFMPTQPLHAVPADKIPTKCRQVLS